MPTTLKYHKTLNPTQIRILQLLNKYRFATIPLISSSLEPSETANINSRLEFLAMQKYVGRNYEKSYKLLHKPASYYLLPKALPVIAAHGKLSKRASKNIYSDKTASDRFIDHSLAIYTVASHLKAVYNTNIDIFTRVDFGDLEHYPKHLNLLLAVRRPRSAQPQPKYLFANILSESSPLFANIATIKKYVEYSENGDWDITGSAIPPILVICETADLHDRLRKDLLYAIDHENDELSLYTTYMSDIAAQNAPDEKIWLPLRPGRVKPESLYNLKSVED